MIGNERWITGTQFSMAFDKDNSRRSFYSEGEIFPIAIGIISVIRSVRTCTIGGMGGWGLISPATRLGVLTIKP